MNTGYFITGTDTEIGKTHVSIRLIEQLTHRGLNISALKPVASGCQQTAQGLRNADALALQAAANTDLDYPLVNRYAFEPAIAPHIAANQCGVEICLADIARDVDSAKADSDAVVVEAVGGWMVPLNATESVADLAEMLNLPVILVVGIGLGCINHALLSLQQIARANVELQGWVANHCHPDTTEAKQQIAAIQARTTATLLAEIPYDPTFSADVRWQL